MKNKFFKRTLGISIPELTIAMGIAGATSLGIMQLMSNIDQSKKTFAQTNQKVLWKSQISFLVNNGQSCYNTFKNTTLSNNTAQLDISEIKSGSDKTVFKPNASNTNSLSPGLQITRLYLHGYTQLRGPSEIGIRDIKTSLVLDLEQKTHGFPTKNYSISFPFFARLNASGRIVSCQGNIDASELSQKSCDLMRGVSGEYLSGPPQKCYFEKTSMTTIAAKITSVDASIPNLDAVSSKISDIQNTYCTTLASYATNIAGVNICESFLDVAGVPTAHKLYECKNIGGTVVNVAVRDAANNTQLRKICKVPLNPSYSFIGAYTGSTHPDLNSICASLGSGWKAPVIYSNNNYWKSTALTTLHDLGGGALACQDHITYAPADTPTFTVSAQAWSGAPLNFATYYSCSYRNDYCYKDSSGNTVYGSRCGPGELVLGCVYVTTVSSPAMGCADFPDACTAPCDDSYAGICLSCGSCCIQKCSYSDCWQKNPNPQTQRYLWPTITEIGCW